MILLNSNDVPTMTSQERVEGLHQALINVYKNQLEGDFVECGIYQGGNLIIAKKFFESVNFFKTFYGYDTFEGMTAPGNFDSIKAHKVWNNSAKCEAGLDLVINIMKDFKIYDKNIKLIKGDVKQTLNDEDNLPKKISILRLDTDWYDSTAIELKILYPRLVSKGFLIIDDYGHWSGCKKAVDEYFGEEFVKDNFKQLDYTGIIYQKN